MYTPSTATSLDDFFDQLEAFIASNGWTTDYFATDTVTVPPVSGKRLHAHRTGGTAYVNMRAYNSEQLDYANLFNSTGLVTYRGLMMNVGTAVYNGANKWYQQTGVFKPDATWMVTGMNMVPATPVTPMPCHFFAHNSGDNIFVTLEYKPGKFQYLMFGEDMSKYHGGTPWTGGNYYSGSGFPYESYTYEIDSGGPGYSFFEPPSLYGYNNGGYGAVSISVDAETGWHWNNSYSYGSKRNIRDINAKIQSRNHHTQPNSVNNLHMFRPVILGVNRTVANNTSYSLIGEIPKVFYCHIHNFAPGQKVTFGSEDYRVFPFGRKAANIYIAPGARSDYFGDVGQSGTLGFAVKELD